MGWWGIGSEDGDGPVDWYIVRWVDGKKVPPTHDEFAKTLQEWLASDDDGEYAEVEFVGIVLSAMADKVDIDKKYLAKAIRFAKKLLKEPEYLNSYKSPKKRVERLKKEIQQIQKYMSPSEMKKRQLKTASEKNLIKTQEKAVKTAEKIAGPKKISVKDAHTNKQILQQLRAELMKFREYRNPVDMEVQDEMLNLSKTKIKGKNFTASCLFAEASGQIPVSVTINNSRLISFNSTVEVRLRIGGSYESEAAAIKKMGFKFQNESCKYRENSPASMEYDELIKTAPCLKLKYCDYFLLYNSYEDLAEIFVRHRCPPDIANLFSKLKMSEVEKEKAVFNLYKQVHKDRSFLRSMDVKYLKKNNLW